MFYPHLAESVVLAKRARGCRQIPMLTTGLLRPQCEAILPLLDRLFISLDSRDADYWASIINMPPKTAHAIVDNIQTYGRLQAQHNFRLIVNCVLSPETLTDAPAILDFCREHNLLASFSPQAVDDWPRYELLVSPEYKAFIARPIAAKRADAPILASDA